MPIDVTFTMIGEPHLRRWLDSVPGAMQRKALRPAMRAGTTPVTPIIKEAMPIGPTRDVGGHKAFRIRKGGNLKASIGRVIRYYKNTGTILHVIGPRWPKGAHGHLLEFGTAERVQYTTGRRTGKVRPRWIMLKIWRREQAQVLHRVGRRLGVEARRLGMVR
jgi:hypothetical protein